jgi:putative SOS response-associated peptidase YedK
MARTTDIQTKFDAMYRPDRQAGMCNHYRNNPEAIASLPTWREFISWDLSAAKAEVWPKYQGVVARVHEGQKILDTMQWGVPLQMKGKRPDTTVTKRITNVRNLSSPFWRSMLTKPLNRCLVPFTQFAEPKPNAGREECWFTVKEDTVSAFAGIWRASDEGNVYAFLTCEPNPLVKPIHPKAMPVILHPDDYDKWLAGEDAEEFAVPFPSQLMSLVSDASSPDETN